MAAFKDLFKSMSYEHTNMANFAAAENWLQSANGSFGPYLNGKWVISNDKRACHALMHPVNGNVVAKICPTSLQLIDSVKEWVESVSNIGTLQKPDSAYQFLQNVSQILEKNANLFAQVELISRKVCMRNTLDVDMVEMVKYFKYYSNFAFKDNNLEWKPKPITLGIMSENTPLIAIAWLLAPAFASQSHVLLYVPCEMALSVMLFVNKCVEGSDFSTYLSVLPGDKETVAALVSCKDLTNVVCFGSIDVTKYVKEIAQDVNLVKEYIALHHGNSSMIIFSSADVDSALEHTVKYLCQNQGIYPWAVKNLILEESIATYFIKRLENRVTNLNIGHICCQSTDIGPIHEGNSATTIGDMVQEVRKECVGLCQITVGGRVNGQESDTPASTLHVCTFRTAQEAIDVVNTSSRELAVSVWTHNMPLALSVTAQLQVGTVWINSHGKVDPAVPLQGWNECGIGEFGGFTGLIRTFKNEFYQDEENTQVENVPYDMKIKTQPGQVYNLYYGGSYKTTRSGSEVVPSPISQNFPKIAEAERCDVEAAVEAALCAQPHWQARGRVSRSQCLHNMADCIKKQLQSLESVLDSHLVGSSLNFIVEEFRAVASECTTSWDKVVRLPVGPEMVKVSKEPLGVIGIAIENAKSMESYLILLFKILITTLSCGNTVVLALGTTTCLPALEILKLIVGVTPPGVLNIVTGDVKKLFVNLTKCTALSYIWYPCNSKEWKKLCRECSSYGKEWCLNYPQNRYAVARRVVKKKSVWMKGEIGIC